MPGEELQSFFLGTSSCIVDENVIFGKAWETRSHLSTVSSETVDPLDCIVACVSIAFLLTLIHYDVHYFPTIKGKIKNPCVASFFQ